MFEIYLNLTVDLKDIKNYEYLRSSHIQLSCPFVSQYGTHFPFLKKKSELFGTGTKAYYEYTPSIVGIKGIVTLQIIRK